MAARAVLILAVGLVAAQVAARETEPGADDWDAAWEESRPVAVWHGFLEGGAGARFGSDPEPGRATLGEARWRAEADWEGAVYTARFKGDAAADAVEEKTDFVVRELSLQRRFGDAIDAKVGRQVLTWGTGDLLFLNDLFPKDYVSFFAGREDEYLKAPSDALRLTRYGARVNLDVAWLPVFQSDEYLDGERFSFYLPAVDSIGVPAQRLDTHDPGGGELALRLFGRAGSAELALYGFRGHLKQPSRIDGRGRLTFAPVSALGASVRAPLGAALVNGEVSWYDSRDDGDGDDPNVVNSQARWLVGYERELVANLRLGVQLYGEWNADHDALRASAPDPGVAPEEWRHLTTARLTYRSHQDTITWSLFAFYSPTDEDAHLRPSITVRASDAWTFVVGANLFDGRSDHTFFGQLEDNSNVYVRLRRYY